METRAAVRTGDAGDRAKSGNYNESRTLGLSKTGAPAQNRHKTLAAASPGTFRSARNHSGRIGLPGHSRSPRSLAPSLLLETLESERGARAPPAPCPCRRRCNCCSAARSTVLQPSATFPFPLPFHCNHPLPTCILDFELLPRPDPVTAAFDSGVVSVSGTAPFGSSLCSWQLAR
jgi:hypothetical protein